MSPLDPRTFIGRTLVIEAPATSANLGAGYDVLAIALEVANHVRVTALPEPGVERSVAGEGVDAFGPASDDRFLRGLLAGLEAAGIEPEALASVGWDIQMDNAIPFGRGMGSSAAATVAGLIAARAFAGVDLSDVRLLEVANTIEGHPDNAAAALAGGFVLVARVEGILQTVRFEPPSGLVAVLFVPERQLATAEMRRVVPPAVPIADAVFNAARVGLAVAAFATGELEWLGAATEDRLHEPYRAAVFPALPVLTAAARAAGALGACLSGAGSTVIAFARSENAPRIQQALVVAATGADEAGEVRTVALRSSGASVRDES